MRQLVVVAISAFILCAPRPAAADNLWDWFSRFNPFHKPDFTLTCPQPSHLEAVLPAAYMLGPNMKYGGEQFIDIHRRTTRELVRRGLVEDLLAMLRSARNSPDVVIRKRGPDEHLLLSYPTPSFRFGPVLGDTEFQSVDAALDKARNPTQELEIKINRVFVLALVENEDLPPLITAALENLLIPEDELTASITPPPHLQGTDVEIHKLRLCYVAIDKEPVAIVAPYWEGEEEFLKFITKIDE